MRTVHLICMVLVVLLLGATTSFGDSSQARAFASQSSPSDSDYDSGSFSVTGAEDGYYNWSYSASVSAYALIRGTDAGSNSAYGFAGVNISGVASDYISATASKSGSLGRDDDSDSASDSGTVNIRAGYGLFLTHGASANASWNSPDGSSQAASGGDASASGSMSKI
jgi:hypothetical protein